MNVLKNMNMPNKLTCLRLMLVPVFCIFVSIGTTLGQFLALLIFLAASITDLLDGHLARKHHQVTDFGKLVDPIADKCLITAAMVFLVAQHRMQAGVCMVFIAREFIISAFRMIAAARGTVIAAGKLGKYKTTLQTIAVSMSIVCLPYGKSAALLGTPGRYLSHIAMWAALALAVLSLIDYLVRNKSAIDWKNL